MTDDMPTSDDSGSNGSGSQISPTRLALILAGGLLLLVLLLSALGPSDVPVDGQRLEALIEEGHVQSILISETSLVGMLRQPILVQVGGQQHRAGQVRIDGWSGSEDQITAWRQAGVNVTHSDEARRSTARDTAWLVAVSCLLLFGVYHLVLQGRKHRREGSPRQRLDEVRAELDAGRISPEEYERRAQAISIEL